jgi:hypothetical protein
MKRFKALILAIFVAISVTAQVAVESKIDSVAILIGQQAHLIVGVTAPKGQSIVFPQYKPYQHITPGVEVIETSNADTSNLDNGLVKVSKIFTITSFDEHLYAIPGMKVKVNGKICQGNPLALKVLTVDVDTLHPNQFFPPKDVQDNPFLWKEWSSIFWLSILMLLFCAIGYYLFIRLHDNKPIITHIRVVKKVLPHQKALNVINKLKEDHIVNSDNPKEYYTKLTDALRLYIEERFGFNAMEMTSSEIIEKMKSTGDQKMIDELHELFQTADLVKFAKYSTLINENDLNLVNAINFIDQTKLEGQPTVEKIVPKLSEEDKRTQKARITIKAFIYVIIITIALALTYIVYNVSQLLL